MEEKLRYNFYDIDDEEKVFTVTKLLMSFSK